MSLLTPVENRQLALLGTYKIKEENREYIVVKWKCKNNSKNSKDKKKKLKLQCEKTLRNKLCGALSCKRFIFLVKILFFFMFNIYNLLYLTLYHFIIKSSQNLKYLKK